MADQIFKPSLFPKMAARYDVEFSSKIFCDMDYILRISHASFDNFRNINVLDLACGTGRIGIEFLNLGSQVTFLDIDPDMLNVLKHKISQSNFTLNKVQVVCDNLNKDKIKLHGTYDIVLLMGNSLGIFENEKNLKNITHQIKNHLSPGGIFLSAHMPLQAFPKSINQESYPCQFTLPDGQEYLRTTKKEVTQGEIVYRYRYKINGEYIHQDSIKIRYFEWNKILATLKAIFGESNVDYCTDKSSNSVDDNTKCIFFKCVRSG